MEPYSELGNNIANVNSLGYKSSSELFDTDANGRNRSLSTDFNHQLRLLVWICWSRRSSSKRIFEIVDPVSEEVFYI